MRNQKGQTLIEVLLAAAMLVILLPALFAAILTSREGRVSQEQRFEATTLLKTTQEIMRTVRERGWSLIAENGTFHPSVDGNSWLLVEGGDVLGDFSRQIIIEDVYRDALGEINPVGTTLDSSTKKITIDISWNTPLPSQIESSFYLTRYLDNMSLVETLEDDFLSGLIDGVTTINNQGGEIVLGAGGQGNWCSPSDSVVFELDLPKQGVAQAISAVEGQLVAGTGENASGVSMAKVEFSQTDPPTAQITGDIDGFKTNDVFIEGSYAYLATDSNRKEVAIIDINSTPFSQVGEVDLPGSQDARGVSVSGNVGLTIQSNKLWSFDLSGKNGTRSLLDSDGVELAGNANEIAIIGDYAYVAMDGDIELQIIDISDPASLQVVGQANVNGADGRDVSVNSTGTRAYLATAYSSGQAEFFIVDTTSKVASQPILGSYDSQGMNPQAIKLVPGNNVVMVGYDAQEYQVISIANENNPTHCGGFEVDAGINDVDAVLEEDGDAFSYILTKDSNLELKVVVGGPGGQYSTEGSFTSSLFDANYSTVFNRAELDATEPVGTNLTFQIGVVDPVNDSCDQATFSFVGPDGTSNTFFDESAQIPLDDDGVGYENPGQCFKYKIFFSTENSGQTPIFEEMRINYSP